MMDSLFALDCPDCPDDATSGLLSRLWVRVTREVGRGAGVEMHHYIECMNCGARFKSCEDDHVEAVDDEEWQRWVGQAPASGGNLPQMP